MKFQEGAAFPKDFDQREAFSFVARLFVCVDCTIGGGAHILGSVAAGFVCGSAHIHTRALFTEHYL